MRKPGKNASLKEQQKYWYRLLAKEGFVDIEQGEDSDVAYRFGPGTPQYSADRAFNRFQTSHKAPVDPAVSLNSFAESAEEYYSQARTLAANWPYSLWSRDVTGQLEYKIWKLHSEGLSSPKIHKILKKQGDLIKGIISTPRTIRRVIERYRAILGMIDYTRLEIGWEPGKATEQILKLDLDLKHKIDTVRTRRYLR